MDYYKLFFSISAFSNSESIKNFINKFDLVKTIEEIHEEAFLLKYTDYFDYTEKLKKTIHQLDQIILSLAPYSYKEQVNLLQSKLNCIREYIGGFTHDKDAFFKYINNLKNNKITFLEKAFFKRYNALLIDPAHHEIKDPIKEYILSLLNKQSNIVNQETKKEMAIITKSKPQEPNKEVITKKTITKGKEKLAIKSKREKKKKINKEEKKSSIEIMENTKEQRKEDTKKEEKKKKNIIIQKKIQKKIQNKTNKTKQQKRKKEQDNWFTTFLKKRKEKKEQRKKQKELELQQKIAIKERQKQEEEQKKQREEEQQREEEKRQQLIQQAIKEQEEKEKQKREREKYLLKNRKRIETRNEIIQTLLNVYHQKKQGYKLMLSIFRALDIYRRKCLTNENFYKELYKKRLEYNIINHPTINLIMLCHKENSSLAIEDIKKMLMVSLRILNKQIDKFRFKIKFNDVLNYRSGFTESIQKRIRWFYFPEKRRPKRNLEELYEIKSVTDGKYKKNPSGTQSLISLLSRKDIIIVNKTLRTLVELYYRDKVYMKMLLKLFTSLDNFKYSFHQLTIEQKKEFEKKFEVACFKSDPSGRNILKKIVYSNPKIRPAEIKSLLSISIKIMKEKIDIGFNRKKREDKSLADSFNPLTKYFQSYDRKLFRIYRRI